MMMMFKNREEALKFLMLLSAFILACILFFTVTNCHHGNNPQPPQKPTPTPLPYQTRVIADGHTVQIEYQGRKEQPIGLGLYMDWERNLSEQLLKERFKYLHDETPFNFQRIFIISTFQKARLDQIGIPVWQIYPLINGKYNINSFNTSWLQYIRQYAGLASESGNALQLVCYDLCGYKYQSHNIYGYNTHPHNPVLSNATSEWKYLEGPGYFPFYHRSVWPLHERTIRQVVNAVCIHPNIIWELTNEGDGGSELAALLRQTKLWIIDQYKRSKSPHTPVFADSTWDAPLWPDELNIHYSHTLQLTDKNGCSSDGARYSDQAYGFDAQGMRIIPRMSGPYFKPDFMNAAAEYSPSGFEQKLQQIKSAGKIPEFHLAFWSTANLPNIHSPADITAFMWGNRSATIQDWRTHLGPYFQTMKEVFER